MGKRTSKSNSSQFFALDAPILRSVRPKMDEHMSVFRRQDLGRVQLNEGMGVGNRHYWSIFIT